MDEVDEIDFEVVRIVSHVSFLVFIVICRLLTRAQDTRDLEWVFKVRFKGWDPECDLMYSREELPCVPRITF